MKKKIWAVLILIILVSTSSISLASMLSDPVFDAATTFLTSTKNAEFDVETSSQQGSITVTRVRLYIQNGNSWIYLGDLPVPTNVGTNTKIFSATMDYSNYIGSGTYRLYTTFCADGYSISRYSNTRTY